MTSPELNSPETKSATTIILFTDLIDSTGWKTVLRDHDYTVKLRQPHDRLFRELLKSFPGAVERDSAGDGFLATFANPSDAVQFALKFHQQLASFDWSPAVRNAPRLPATRIGIHLGEVSEYADAMGMKIAGQAVDLGARIMGLAVGGQTLLTRHVFDSARQHVVANPAEPSRPLTWANHGQYKFKGSDDPFDVCEVSPNDGPLALPADSEKAKRVYVDPDAEIGSWRPSIGAAIPRRDGWILDSQLGEGGFGEVWLAHNKRTKESRVFKFCFDADRLRSFKRELTFFKLIQSELGTRPDFVRLYDVQVEKPPYFLESEYVEGGNLSQWLDRHGGMEKWLLESRLKFLAGVARAVAAAHSLGIIHKDLKPSNVLVSLNESGEPQPLLADFGIGVLADRTLLSRGNITETGFTESMMLGNDSSRTGTRLYSPPEAQIGKPVTTGNDVYALGVMLFQLAVGNLQRPLGVGWEKAIVINDPNHNALLIEDVSSATFSELPQRMSTAAELANRLETIDVRVSERKEAAERAERDRYAAERRKRRTYQTRAAMATIVVLTVGGGVAVWQAIKATKAEYNTSIQLNKTREAETIAAAETLKAKESERNARRQSADFAIKEGIRHYENQLTASGLL